jgi:small-conductance mechanosensitive channel
MRIPEGRDAIRSWRLLPRDTRHRLLRGTTAHPDPQVAATAVGYAREMRFLGPRWLGRVALAILWLMGLMFLLFALAILLTAVTATEDGRFIIAAPLLWTPFMIWYLWRTGRLQRAMIRMENINAPGLTPPQAAGLTPA